jgi:hypothetical protein
MNKETMVTSAFRVHCSMFSCSLAAALPGQGASLGEEAVLADSGWAGEKSGLLSILLGRSPLVLDVKTIEVLLCQNSFPAAC